MQQLISLARRQVWAGLLGSFSFALVGSVIQYIGTGGVSGLTPVVAVLVGGVVWLVVGRMVMGKPEQQTPDPPESVEGKVFSQRSVRQLTDLTRGLTTVEGDNATKLHIGKWLRVQGRILNVYEQTEEKMMIRLIHGSRFFRRGIFAYFDRGSRDRLETLQLGEEITVDGRIDIITGAGITLTKCELVDK